MKGGMQFTFALILASFSRHAAGYGPGDAKLVEGGPVEGTVGGDLGSAVGGTAGGAVGDTVEGAVKGTVGGALGGDGGALVGTTVGGALGATVGGASGATVGSASGAAVGSASGAAVGGASGAAAGNTAKYPYPDKKLSGITGFAKSGGTVGGSMGEVVYIKNLQDLKKHITDAVPQTLVIAENINAPKKETIFLGSNKSLIGSYKKNVLSNVYFHTAKNSSNIIFQNLYFKHNPKNIDNSDTQLIIEFGGRYWIDHCTFDGGKVDLNDLGKLLTIEAVYNVTISYCKFEHHNYGLILGFPSDNPTGVAKYKNLPQLTMMFNFFDDINARAPGLMRYGMFHVMNNYIQRCRIGFTISSECRIFSENNVFTNPRKDAEVLDDKGSGFFKDSGSIDMPKKVKSKQDKWHPSKEYRYHVQTTEYTQKFCKKFSGVQIKRLDFAAGNFS